VKPSHFTATDGRGIIATSGKQSVDVDCSCVVAVVGRSELLRRYVIQVDETPVEYLGDKPGQAVAGYLSGFADDAAHRCR
jgi:hypothetical protein